MQTIHKVHIQVCLVLLHFITPVNFCRCPFMVFISVSLYPCTEKLFWTFLSLHLTQCGPFWNQPNKILIIRRVGCYFTSSMLLTGLKHLKQSLLLCSYLYHRLSTSTNDNLSTTIHLQCKFLALQTVVLAQERKGSSLMVWCLS